MSVLIRGMKMPKECRECYLLEYYEYLGETQCSVTRRMLAERGKPISFDGRPGWCPLVEVPEPHGDLIDRGAFKADYGMKDDCAYCKKELCGKVKACEYDYIYSKMNFCGWLDNADVVIEAEGE